MTTPTKPRLDLNDPKLKNLEAALDAPITSPLGQMRLAGYFLLEVLLRSDVSKDIKIDLLNAYFSTVRGNSVFDMIETLTELLQKEDAPIEAILQTAALEAMTLANKNFSIVRNLLEHVLKPKAPPQ